MTYNVRNIAIAIVMAIAAAAVVLVYTTSYRQSVTRGQKRVDVMVASRDIVAGTPGRRGLGRHDAHLGPRRRQGAGRPVDDRRASRARSPAQTIYAGQQVVAATFGTSTEQAAAAAADEDRARDARACASRRPACMIGDVKAGDKVDVFATHPGRQRHRPNNDVRHAGLLIAGAIKVGSPSRPDDPNAKGGLAKGADKDEDRSCSSSTRRRRPSSPGSDGADDTRGGQSVARRAPARRGRPGAADRRSRRSSR